MGVRQWWRKMCVNVTAINACSKHPCNFMWILISPIFYQKKNPRNNEKGWDWCWNCVCAFLLKMNNFSSFYFCKMYIKSNKRMKHATIWIFIRAHIQKFRHKSLRVSACDRERQKKQNANHEFYWDLIWKFCWKW